MSTPALEKTDERREGVVSGGRFVTQTAVFFGADDVGLGFEDDAGAFPFDVFKVLEV